MAGNSNLQKLKARFGDFSSFGSKSKQKADFLKIKKKVAAPSAPDFRTVMGSFHGKRLARERGGSVMGRFSAAEESSEDVTTSRRPNRSTNKLFWLAFASASLTVAYLWPSLAPGLSTVLPKSVMGEQCSRVWIQSNLTRLRQDLDDNVFGQHVATRQILAALQRRWAMANDDHSSKWKQQGIAF